MREFNPRFHTTARLDHYAACISAAGSPLSDVCGFINCTINEISHPVVNQDIVYNGYKKGHALKYQAIVTPDGLMCPTYGPVEGRQADGGILEMSGLDEMCTSHAIGANGRQLFVYGDPAYGLSNTVISGVRRIGGLTDNERKFNLKMSKLRQSVEWGFGNVSRNFAFMGYPNGLKLGLQPVGRFYLLVVIFTNIWASMYPSEISVKFQCAPPPLEDYLESFNSVLYTYNYYNND
ncbi:DDE superfamily endonuclease [Ceratobasidium sp. AG-Ba]|nr:DDE superfamily endonuclease [Ceratobasidium sp. AG-Ba]